MIGGHGVHLAQLKAKGDIKPPLYGFDCIVGWKGGAHPPVKWDMEHNKPEMTKDGKEQPVAPVPAK